MEETKNRTEVDIVLSERDAILKKVNEFNHLERRICSERDAILKKVNEFNRLERRICEVVPGHFTRCNNCKTFGVCFPFDRQCGDCNSFDVERFYSEVAILRFLEALK